MAVKKGDKIKVEYEGKLETGEVFDSSEKHGKPLEFEVGSGQLIKGFDEGVIGMEKGDEKEIKLAPDQAYGTKRDDLFAKLPRDQFPEDKQPEKGMMLMLSSQDGRQIPATISEVSDKEVTVDMNHPLSGKTLIFKIKVVEISA
jgi:FKBP-type peptidyl-prolyl cis-trans isomerase 2